MNPHDEAFLHAFVVRRFRERCLAKKQLLVDAFCHDMEGMLLEKFVVRLPHGCDGGIAGDGLGELIRTVSQAVGFRRLSAYGGYDGDFPVTRLAEEGQPDSTWISFEPGELVWFCPEAPCTRLLLVRDEARRKKVRNWLGKRR